MRQDGKRPDSTTILPWSRGRPLAWDVTVPDTYADAHVVNTAREAGAAANHAATNKNIKYSQLSNTHVFVPVAIGTIRRRNCFIIATVIISYLQPLKICGYNSNNN